MRIASGKGRRMAVLALFVGLGATAASPALTLGDLQVRSSLGEPLSAVVRVDAAAGEIIRRECFAPGLDAVAVPGVPRIDDLRFVLDRQGANATLRVMSGSPVREPLTQVVLQVRCPGLPRLTRAFVVMLDPIAIAATTIRRPPSAPAARPVHTVSRPVGGDIAPGSNYTVRAGDTLSGIAARIAGRPSYSVWPLAAKIKALNPGAFENGRADRLSAGSRLRIPTLDGATSAARSEVAALATPTRQIPVDRLAAEQGSVIPVERRTSSQRPQQALIETPVLLGEAVGTGEVSYLVITLELSQLSRERIAQRAEQPVVAAVAEPTPVAVPAALPEPADNLDVWYSNAWYWLLALLVVLGGAAMTMIYMRREPAVVTVDSPPATPWELGDDEEDISTAGGFANLDEDATTMVVEEPVAKVYDDFTGTFVEPVTTEEVVPVPARGSDPEDDIQTHLMPMVDEDPAEQPGLSLAETDTPKLEGLEDRIAAYKPPPQKDQIDVATLEEVDEPFGEDGWVELDFEATQILEQDYLAEYAATLKDKVKEQSDAAEAENAATDSDDGEDSLLAASELIDALDGDLISPEVLQLNEDEVDPDNTSELAKIADEIDEDPTASVTTLELESDDNVVAIDKGKKIKDEDSADEAPRERGKNS